MDMPLARRIIPSGAVFSIPLMPPMQSQRVQIIRPRRREQIPMFPLSIDHSEESEGPTAKLTALDISESSDGPSIIPPHVAAVLKLFQSAAAAQDEPSPNKQTIIPQHISIEPRPIEHAPIVRAMEIRMTKHDPSQAGTVSVRRFIPINQPNHPQSPHEHLGPHFLPHPTPRVSIMPQAENHPPPPEPMPHHDEEDEEEEDDITNAGPLFRNPMRRFNRMLPMPPPHAPFMPFQQRHDKAGPPPFFVGRGHHARSDMGHHFIRPRSLAPGHDREHDHPVQHL
jgi:hypothetical protein